MLNWRPAVLITTASFLWSYVRSSYHYFRICEKFALYQEFCVATFTRQLRRARFDNIGPSTTTRRDAENIFVIMFAALLSRSATLHPLLSFLLKHFLLDRRQSCRRCRTAQAAATAAVAVTSNKCTNSNSSQSGPHSGHSSHINFR